MPPGSLVLLPEFSPTPFESEPAEIGFKKISVADASLKTGESQMQKSGTPAKKAIRRSALEAKKAQEADQQKQSSQEKEWEIPAFMRLKK